MVFSIEKKKHSCQTYRFSPHCPQVERRVGRPSGQPNQAPEDQRDLPQEAQSTGRPGVRSSHRPPVNKKPPPTSRSEITMHPPKNKFIPMNMPCALQPDWREADGFLLSSSSHALTSSKGVTNDTNEGSVPFHVAE